ncbi:hypothetical protein DL98DRAFT_353667, partial [Cadophora sp. DSE1049]
TSHLQAQVDDPFYIMRENIKKVLERGENLDILKGKTDDLVVQSDSFSRDANEVNTRMCSKHIKSSIYLISCVILLLVVLLI